MPVVRPLAALAAASALLGLAALRAAPATAAVPRARTAGVAEPAEADAARRWGEAGHRMIAQAAARALPLEMPGFFRTAAPQLAYLNPEPDRWRAPREQTLDGAMNAAYAAEHFVDMELLTPTALAAPDRFAYADSLRAAGRSVATVGLLPFRIDELTARLREEFRLWRTAPNAQVRGWVEARIIDDAGILGHYVADAANPQHTTVHYNGWAGENPKGYSTDRTIHGRFESEYVQTHVTLGDVAPLVAREPRRMLPLRDSVRAYLARSHAQVTRLYELERREPFGSATTGAEPKRFVIERLAAGATALRDIWWTTWISSADPIAPPGR